MSAANSVTWPGRITGLAMLAATLLFASGCANRAWVIDAPDVQQVKARKSVQELGCISDCRIGRKTCNDHARYDYGECQRSYGRAMRDDRWCRSKAMRGDDCGAPWWPCAENLYGYCTNRYYECIDECERQFGALR